MVLRYAEMEVLIGALKKVIERWGEDSCQKELLAGMIEMAAGLSEKNTFMDFMKQAGSYSTRDYCFYYVYEIDAVSVYRMIDGSEVYIADGIKSKEELEERLEKQGFDDLRFCNACGAPMQEGFTDECIYFDTELEFKQHMDRIYDENMWGPGRSWDGYYAYLEDGQWLESEFYYTEW